jgi:hypothetical protein
MRFFLPDPDPDSWCKKPPDPVPDPDIRISGTDSGYPVPVIRISSLVLTVNLRHTVSSQLLTVRLLQIVT